MLDAVVCHDVMSPAVGGFFANLFTTDFIPRAQCVGQRGEIIWLHVISDLAIALAYFSIPVALASFVRQRKDLAYPWIFWLFAAFILACGLTHVMGALAFWYPMYRFDGLIKAVTGGVSMLTAVLLWPLIPRALQLPSPAQLRAANEALGAEIRERRDAESRLAAMAAELESRVASRTAELELANASLRASEERFRFMAESIPQIVWTARPDGVTNYHNHRLDDLTGVAREELRRLGWIHFRHPDDRTRASEVWARALETGEPYECEYRLRAASGEYRWHLARAVPMVGEDGAIVRWFGTCTDVHDARLQRDALRRSEAAQRLMVELHDATRALRDPEEVIRQFVTRTGQHFHADRCAYAEVEEDGEHTVVSCDYTTPGVPSVVGRHRLNDYGPAVIAELRRGRTLVIADAETDPRTAGAGAASHAAIRARAVLSVPLVKAGRLVAIFVLHCSAPHAWSEDAVEIAEQVAERTWFAVEHARVARSLAESEASLRRFVETANEGILRVGPDDRIVFANDHHSAMMGYAPGETVGMNVLDFVFPEDRERAAQRRQLRREQPEGAGERYEHRLRGKDGREVWVLNSTTVVRRNGAYDGTYSMISDITDRRRAEEALRESEERHRSLVEQTVAGIASADTQGRFVMANDHYCRMLGYSREELMAMRMQDVTHPDDLPRNITLFRRAVEEGRPFEIEKRYVRRDGSVLWVHNSVSAVFDPSGRARAVVAVCVDVTKRRRAEEALRESEERFRLMADSAPVLIWLADTGMGCTWFNKTWLDFTGRTLEEEIGDGWARGVHPEDADRCTSTYRESFERRAEFKMEYRLRNAAGEYRWILDHGVPRFAGDGAFIGYIGSCIDVTDAVRAREAMRRHGEELGALVAQRTTELEQSHEALRLAERMAAMGTLAAGLGHDMGNMVMPMRLWLDTLDAATLPDDARQAALALRGSTEYLRSLAAGLRSLALDPDDPNAAVRYTRPSEWWAEVRGLYRAPLPKGVQLEASGLDDAPAVAVPPHALTQAVFNLVQNAGDAMRERGSGRITVEATAEGDAVRVTVRDDGPGMSPEVRQRCLEPFFTTKPRGRGTGLGLAVVHGIARRYGARLEIESEPGVGSAFSLIVPVALAPSRPRTAAVSITDPRRAALVRALASAAGWRLVSAPLSGAPGADLWVTDARVPEADLRSHLATGGRVVTLGPRPELDGSAHAIDDPTPAAIRRALAEAMDDAR